MIQYNRCLQSGVGYRDGVDPSPKGRGGGGTGSALSKPATDNTRRDRSRGIRDEATACEPEVVLHERTWPPDRFTSRRGR